MKLLENKSAIVTGATRGIGRGIALEFAKQGANVAFTYSSSVDAAKALETELQALGVAAKGYQSNAADFEAAQELAKEVLKEFGSIDILVNNAGITRDMLTMMMQPEDFTDVIDLHLNGAFWASQAAFQGSMMGQKMGRIINVASIVGQIGNPGQANYAAAKGGVIGMTRALAKEFGARNICVNSVCPGFIESDMTKDLDKTNLLPFIPLKRFGQPQEVAGLVKFLGLSPSGGYMTGHCFNVDGGMAIGAT